MSEETHPETNSDQIIARLEALLFVAAGAVLPSQLATALDLPQRVIENNLELLENRLAIQDPPRGLRLQRHHGRVQLTTSPDIAPVIERFLGLETSNRLRGCPGDFSHHRLPATCHST